MSTYGRHRSDEYAIRHGLLPINTLILALIFVAVADVADKSGVNPSSRRKSESPAGSNDNAAKPPNGEDQPSVAGPAANDAAPPARSNGSEDWHAAPRRHPEWWTR